MQMKTSIYIEENLEQINLTPENEYEKKILDRMKSKDYSVTISKGEFYLCQANYIMKSEITDQYIIIIKEKPGV
jgi:hypothetical protein